jgi:hypothetical protein
MAEALPSPSLTIREAPRKNPSGSLSFRELLPQSADSCRHLDEVGEAVPNSSQRVAGYWKGMCLLLLDWPCLGGRAISLAETCSSLSPPVFGGAYAKALK